MKGLGNVAAKIERIDEDSLGQRVDNFLLARLKGVPRSHIYRILRGGEVRVNSRRVDVTYRLQIGDEVRIPPVRVAARSVTVDPDKPVVPGPDPGFRAVFEDDALLVIDKPAGVAVHGGSGISFGVIERLRSARPELKFLELIHRLDRETSGLLMIAKKRSVLTAFHAAWRAGAVRKEYLALVRGAWPKSEHLIELSLRKYLTKDGERRVAVDRTGQDARTVVRVVRSNAVASLVLATLETGRTHQLRVHFAHRGHPLLGDDKYGDFELNKSLVRDGLKRMFLHAHRLRFTHPASGEALALEAALPPDLARFVDSIVPVPGHAATV